MKPVTPQTAAAQFRRGQHNWICAMLSAYIVPDNIERDAEVMRALFDADTAVSWFVAIERLMADLEAKIAGIQKKAARRADDGR
jgi:hypothetical protein